MVQGFIIGEVLFPGYTVTAIKKKGIRIIEHNGEVRNI